MRKRRVVYTLALLGALLFLSYYKLWFSWYIFMFLILLAPLSLLLTLPSYFSVRRRGGRGATRRGTKPDVPNQKRGIWRVRSVLSMFSRTRVDMIACSSVVRGGEGYIALRDGGGGWLVCSHYDLRLTVSSSASGSEESYHIELCGGTEQHLELDTSHCSLITCTLTRCAVVDYLGLFALPLRIPDRVRVLVAPKPAEPSPKTDFSMLNRSVFRPKPGGGFSETHEYRAYLPGDSMRDIHWKLTAKQGEPVVREPQIPLRSLVVITCDLPASPSELDSTLDRLCGMSTRLISTGVDHVVSWQVPGAEAVRSVSVSNGAELNRAVFALLSSYQFGHAQAFEMNTPSAACRYHIGNSQGVRGQ